ncbi:MAG: hypothetical protein Q8R13_03855 [bacterium]|nr:hypothetical protein [bacterium]MDZ4295994.1 hypothetical protein [Patescibacteria group bacterium]
MKIFDIIPKDAAKTHPRVKPQPLAPASEPEKIAVTTDTSAPLRPSPVAPENDGAGDEALSRHEPQPEEESPVKTRRENALAVLYSKERRPPLLEEIGHQFRRRMRVPITLFIGGVVVIAAVGVLTFIYPRVTVAITTKKADIPVEVPLTIDAKEKAVGVRDGRIPGKLLSFTEETTRTFPATGRRTSKTKASGSITIFNAYSTQPQTLIATTRFQAPDGKIFRIVKNITVPSAELENGKIKPSSTIAQVEADEPGPAYNIGPTDFTIPGFKGSAKFTGFYAKSYDPMQGGVEGETAVIKEEDIAGARQTLRNELTPVLTRHLGGALEESWATFPESVLITITTATPSQSPGAAAENFRMHFKLTLAALAYKKADLEAVLIARAQDEQSAIPGTLRVLEGIRAQDAEFSAEKKSFIATVEATVTMSATLEEDKLKNAILGMKEFELREHLSKEVSIDTAKVTFWPFWVKRVPNREDLVALTID